MPDFELQGLLDDEIGYYPDYRLVHGRYNMLPETEQEIETYPRTTPQIFQYSTVYYDHAALNEGVFAGLLTLTGCLDMQTQDEAYGAFFYQYWILEGEARFADFLDGVSRRCRHVRSFWAPESFEALTNAVMERCPGSVAAIVGDVLRVSHDGIMQGFRLPSDEAYGDFVLWLDVRNGLTFRELVGGLERCGWRKPA